MLTTNTALTSQRLLRGFWAAAILSLVLPTAGHAAQNSKKSAKTSKTEEEIFAPVSFAARPAESELEPRDQNERDASVLVLSYSVDHKADISNWKLSGTTTKRYQARYLVRDTNGVANLKKHTFFGDETDVVVANVQGQTISPDGSVHPIDPVKDIRKLDIERARKADDILRTVSFPRVEPGAILDLAWTAQQKQLPSIEVVDLEGPYPIRDLSVKVRGRLIGQGKAFMLGSGEYYWVPFFSSRVPENTKVRMSTAFDLELSAQSLPSYQHEPLSPPATRTSAWLAVVPQSFHIGNWKQHFHLFEDPSTLPDVAAGKREWFETTIGAGSELARADELGLQVLPLSHSKKQRADFQATFRYIDGAYKSFLARKKEAETPEQLARIAPPELTTDERVDRILDHVAKTIELRPNRNPALTLSVLRKRGYGSGFPVMYYTYYLLQQAKLPVTMVWIADRTQQMIVPSLNDKSFYGGRFFLEVDGESGKRYVIPYLEHYERYSLDDDYLGSVLFRQVGKKKPWEADRVDLATNVSTGFKLQISSPLVVDEETEAVTTFEPIGNMSTFFKHSYAKRTELDARSSEPSTSKKRKKKAKVELAKLEATVESTSRVLRAVLGSWLDITVEDDLELTTPDYVSGSNQDGSAMRVWNQALPWEPKVEDLGDSVLVPPIPMSADYRNKLVDDHRSQPIWPRGGDLSTQMNWQVGEEFAAPAADQIRAVELKGPGGLRFELAQRWDAGSRVFTTDVNLVRPFLLGASDYSEIKTFFVEVQRAVEQPILLKRL